MGVERGVLHEVLDVVGVGLLVEGLVSIVFLHFVLKYNLKL